MNLLLAYIILNNRYGIQIKEPEFYPDIEGEVANYCAHNNGCRECNLNQDVDNPKFTSSSITCYRGFLARLYFSKD